ncbi:hypothetical protein ASPU41_16670 [Arthrobacter sp. U41]|nr:hypothetical protein ASPU41_16670 [Arthrobacter sp. U41]
MWLLLAAPIMARCRPTVDAPVAMQSRRHFRGRASLDVTFRTFCEMFREGGGGRPLVARMLPMLMTACTIITVG